MAKKVVIPDVIKTVFEAYGFSDSVKLESALATRSTSEWFAILFYDDDAKELFAVDFRINIQQEWEVQNDYVGPFATEREFLTDKLIRSII